METCDYNNDSFEDYIRCDLPKGHEGRHRVVIEWDTKPYDVCQASSHVWGEWTTYVPGTPTFRSWEIEPQSQRKCERCGSMDFEGGKRNQDISDVLMASLFPSPNPLVALSIPRVGHTSVKWVEDKL